MIITSFALCVCVCVSWICCIIAGNKSSAMTIIMTVNGKKKCKKRRMEVWGAKRALLVLNMEMKHIF